MGPSSRPDTTFAAMTVAAGELDPLACARSLELPLTVYWDLPQAAAPVVGLGQAGEAVAGTYDEVFERLAQLSRRGAVMWGGEEVHPPGPWFGGLAFDLRSAPGEAWPGFPLSRWVLPEVLLWSAGGRTYLTAFCACDAQAEVAPVLEALRAKAAGLVTRLRPDKLAPARPQRLEPVADRQAWDQLMRSALEAIDSSELTKVVAARAVEVRGSAEFDALSVLDALRRGAPSCTTFFIRGTAGAALMGATPELLCTVNDRALETMALGATRVGQEPGVEGWAGDKERREHAAIVEGIAHALRPHTLELLLPGRPRVRELPRLAHLETPIRGKLRPGAGVAEVVRALHPTPAVGGVPRERAMAFLRNEEGLDRGWYAGAVGWLGRGSAELRVALRCGLVQGDRARLFAGAGIVAGSSAEAEWHETEAKTRLMLDALGGGHG